MAKLLLTDIKIFLTLVILSIFILFFDYFKLLNLPKSLLQSLTVPIQYGFYKTGLSVSHQFEFIFIARTAAQKNKALEDQIAEVLSENARLRKDLAEAQGALAQQTSLNPETFNLVAARPIGLVESRYLLIDKGLNDNLKLNQPVVFKDNFIGRIKEVSSKQSKIILESDPDSVIAAFVSSKDGRAKGVLKGQFGSEMLLDKILHREPVAVSDLVYSDGTEGNIPRGLILGNISQVLERENEIFKQAKVKTIFDVSDLDIVFVITN
ncbi:rod shape-determining protein MreC [Candidatus Daviesbacteria bacterium]|nr:rod shape-determining protein MreC [Candidatus Daviesbacteria bacterium]